MKFLSLFRGLVLGAVLIPSAARAQLLLATTSGEFTIVASEPAPLTAIRVMPAYFMFDGDVISGLLADRTFTEADDGVSVSLTAANDAHFNSFAGFLTNQIDDPFGSSVGFDTAEIGGGYGPESSGWNFVVPTVGPDLFGYHITRMEFTLNRVSFSYLNPDPIWGGIRSTAEFSYALDVYGTRISPVPEASTVLTGIAGFCFVGLAVVRAKRRPRHVA